MANSIWRILWHLIGYAQRLYWLDAALWFLMAALGALPGIFIRNFFDQLTGRSPANYSPWLWISLVLATGLARVVAIFAGRLTKTEHRFLISTLLRHNLLQALLQRPAATLTQTNAQGQTHSIGSVVNHFREDVLQLEDLVVGTNEIMAAGITAIAALGLLLTVNVSITLFLFLPLAIIIALVQWSERRLKRYRQASRQATQRVTALINELFTAVQAVKVTGSETYVLAELRSRGDRRQKLMVQDRVFTALLEAGFAQMTNFGTGLVLLLTAPKLSQGLTVGDFALFVYYLNLITHFFSFLGSFLASAKQSDVSCQRMGEILDAPPAPPDIHPLTLAAPLYLPSPLKAAPPLPPAQRCSQISPLKTLRIEGLTYYYPDQRRGIEDISFTLRQGSLTVITGPIGAGKTTLLQVFLGLLPCERGAWFWNGQAIANPQHWLIPPQVAYLPQIPQLFSSSLGENICLNWPNTTAELEWAIATASLDTDLKTFPEGLETPIGTRGLRLSGGQKQRVAIARMLLRQPQLLICDDLASALDIETEQRLWRRLLSTKGHSQEAKSSQTYLIVSHRPQILAQADQILYLQAGRLEKIITQT
ncbi:ABC transporter ATP-binding protein [Picosynechococcus sp. PCC 7117]|uniref:ABC transporter ATP-binding protein n=1 Tax=Picosynechococcus sp. PCC 7117 TaxID=195498 RepID=UPI00081074D5|nr:ABC transporter ATP-binding protein [Picosynechococcus sp. PCC 7117]ANV88956.1 ABC transporter ATP-binding protein [Picosynechococcus sp. PCC 7117]